jgi:hypothetical protein
MKHDYLIIAMAMIMFLIIAPVATALMDEGDGCGTVIFLIRAGGSAQDRDIFIKNNLQNIAPIDNAYHPDTTDIVGQNPNHLKVEIHPDGELSLRLAPGKFTAYLRNGNGGQPESQSFEIIRGETTRVTFLGHAVGAFILQDATVTGKIKPVRVLCWDVPNSLDGVRITIDNPNAIPVNVDVTATTHGKLFKFGAPWYWIEDITRSATYNGVPAGVSDYYINFPNRVYLNKPTVDITSNTYL